MAARLPPLCHARDAEFWRQRIHKEQRAGATSGTALALQSGWSTPRPIAIPSPRQIRQPFATARPSTQAPGQAALMAAPIQPTMYQPFFRPTATLMPPRSPELQRALQTGWTEPPLVLSKGFNEPPRVFRKYLEASTHSAHKPPAPILHWKTAY